MSRVAVIGDIGGHEQELRRALIKLGADRDTLRLPDDLTVVQVGDLVHRGPDSLGVVQIVQRYRETQPERWVQLLGNHEQQVLMPEAFDWNEELDPEVSKRIADWWLTGAIRLAAGLETKFGPVLVTHAGLTAGLWAEIDRPRTVQDAVAAVNALPDTKPHLAWRPGLMLGGGEPDLSAGVCWAEAARELYPSWLAAEADGRGVPFGLVHGHSSAFDWSRNGWRGSKAVWDRFTPLPRVRHVRGLIGGQFFAGIDPDFGYQVEGSWAPLLFKDARVVGR